MRLSQHPMQWKEVEWFIIFNNCFEVGQSAFEDCGCRCANCFFPRSHFSLRLTLSVEFDLITKYMEWRWCFWCFKLHWLQLEYAYYSNEQIVNPELVPPLQSNRRIPSGMHYGPLSQLILQRIVKESSWEVSLSIPHQNLQYIFVLSVLAARKTKNIIVHLVRKAITVEIVGFCVVLSHETYMEAHAKIEKLILDEIKRPLLHDWQGWAKNTYLGGLALLHFYGAFTNASATTDLVSLDCVLRKWKKGKNLVRCVISNSIKLYGWCNVRTFKPSNLPKEESSTSNR